jgi:hypothetical protein
MLKILALIVLGAILAVLIYAATKPNTFRIQRKTTINARPEAIYPFLSDFHKWRQWSPFEKIDPAMKRTFEGPEQGVGAVYAWNGDKRAGAGRMEITQTTPPINVALDLHFTRPFKSNNVVEFLLEPEGETTVMTWAMHGPLPYMAKIMHVFINMDKMVGKDFEAGLATLKTLSEN